MRFLANENVPLASVRRLREAGHDVASISEISAGAKDVTVLEAVSALLEIPGLRLEGRYTVVDRQRIRQRPLP